MNSFLADFFFLGWNGDYSAKLMTGSVSVSKGEDEEEENKQLLEGRQHSPVSTQAVIDKKQSR